MACLLLASAVHAAPNPYVKPGNEVVDHVRTRFLDPKKGEAWAAKHRGYGAAASSAEDFARRTNEALAELGTSHTVLYPRGTSGHTALTAIFQQFLQLPRVEHTSLGVDLTETPEGFFVRHVFPGGPAARAGVLRGDRLVSVEGKPFHPVTSLDGRAGKATRLALERTRGAAPLPLSNGDLLYLAVMDVEVEGVRLEGTGVPVDVEVPEALPYAAGKDPQLDKALDVAASAAGRR